jgi:predicted ArsR family transcriptional regulator
MGKVGEMVDVLGQWGYTPEVSLTDGGRTARINLAHCPFIDLAKKNPAVVCGIHRGLIAGAMEQLGEGEAEVSLEPFVAPNLCRAHVTASLPLRP